jgi:hypothetical protein
MFGSFLLWECLHSGALAGAQGGVYGGCRKAYGCRRETAMILLLVSIILVILIMSSTNFISSDDLLYSCLLGLHLERSDVSYSLLVNIK